MNFKTKIILIFVLVLCFVNVFDVAESAENAILVNQPAYRSMNFYVYKPANLHKDFFVTYDGYLVYKDSKGVWLYGSYDKNGITKTDYIVGSVIPTVIQIKPYDPKISSVAPILENPPKENRVVSPMIIETNNNALNIDVLPVSDWTQNSNFMSIGKWQKSVDRIGVLERPRTPVAWKGDYPDVIFAWTGLEWKQLNAKTSNVSAQSTLRREVYSLTKYTKKINALHWLENDSNILSQYARIWGYRWLGQIFLEKGY